MYTIYCDHYKLQKNEDKTPLTQVVRVLSLIGELTGLVLAAAARAAQHQGFISHFFLLGYTVAVEFETAISQISQGIQGQ